MPHRRSLLFLLLLSCLAAGCAPVGLVETTANVVDEYTAFRQARKENTREGWERFIRQYPSSSKAKQARQWVEMMPQEGTASSSLQEELRRAEEERLARQREQEAELVRLRAEQERLAAEAEEARRQEELRRQEEQRKQEEAARLAKPQRLQPPTTAPQFTPEQMAFLAELKKREEELNRREEDLKKKEAELSASRSQAIAAGGEDIDTVPSGGIAPGEERFAVVIGIEKYRDIQASADYAEKDARTMLLYLRDFLGFPEQNIKFLKGDRATKSDLAKELELWLPLVATQESQVFVYFSGHGSPDVKSQQAYLLPYDGDPKALEITAYPLKRLYEKLHDLPAREITVALDSCFSGAGGRSALAQGARPLITRLDTGKISPAGNLTVFTAASGEEITGSYESQKHGLFTYFFLRGLRGEADADKDGWVSVREEYDYLKKNVAAAARRDLRDQTPQILPDLAALGEKAAVKLSKISK